MIEDITKKFDSELRKISNGKEDIKRFLVRHERKSIVLGNLVDQIKKCERQHFSIQFNVHKYRSVIKDVAKMFASAALKQVEQQHVSRLEQQRIRKENEAIEDAKAIAEDLEKEATATSLTSYPGSVCT